MRTFDYKLRNENPLSQSAGGRYHPASVLLWQYRNRKFRAVIGAGSSDEVEAFRAGDEIVVVSRNCGLGYVGAEVFDYRPSGEPDEISPTRVTATARHDVFFQSATEDLSTDKWEDWTLRHLARVLSDWLY